MKNNKETAVFCFKINGGKECEIPKFTVGNNGRFEIIFEDRGEERETYGNLILHDDSGNECELYMKRI